MVLSPDKKCIVSGSPVMSVAFSPDGKHIVSGSYDKTVRLWDADSGQQIGQPLTGHFSAVSSVAFSPDGKHIVSGSYDKTVRLWDADSGQSIGGALHGDTGGYDGLGGPWSALDSVLSVAFSPDGKRIVSGSYMTVRFWHADGRYQSPQIGSSGYHTDRVSSVAFSPDGKRIVSGSYDKTLRLWDAATEHSIGHPLTGHTDAVTSVAFSPDGKRIVSGSKDTTLRLWPGRLRPGEPAK